jgi:DNA polymerase delta subunit 1
MSKGDKETFVRIFALDKEQHTYMLRVFGFLSYFYIRCPQQLDTSRYEDIANFFRRIPIGDKGEKCSYVKHEVVKKESVMNYKPEGKREEDFIKIYLKDPRHVPKLKEYLLEIRHIERVQFDGLTDNEDSYIFEANMAFALRFMIDKGIVGMGWIHIPAGCFKLLDLNQSRSMCQVAISLNHQDIKAHGADDPQWSEIAPLRIMSFDIECASERGFPQPNRDPVITIGVGCKLHTSKKEDYRILLQLKETMPVSGATLHCFEDEYKMLGAFQELIQVYDPDIITGYNIISFDLKYMLERIDELHSHKPYKGLRCSNWTRILKEKTSKKKGRLQSKIMGNRETFDIHISGRIQLDMMIVMMMDHNLSSYSLNNVCMKFLGEQKEDVHYSMISTLQNGTPEDRKRIASYCLKDALLPLRLIDKLKNIFNFVEMARVTGVPINVLLKRGQQIKVLSQLYRTTLPRGLIIPNLKIKAKGDDSGPKGYQGGFVLEPKTGFYKMPIATLDFASLYPSIMIAHNICYTTKLERTGTLEAGKHFTITPSGHRFVKADVQKGLLPQILENLLSARKRAKKLLEEAKAGFKAATTEKEKSEYENLIGVYNGRQLAIKVSANSVYGFTGAQVGALPCLAIAGSVTAFGRQMIENTRDWVMAEFNQRNGYPHDSEVIYGDTDSVMIKFGFPDVATCMEYGRKASQIISKKFIAPIKLEFEKVYFPYLLLKKKKYAGLYWTNPVKFDYKDCKGLEMVRRDNCLMARKATEKVLDILLIDRDEAAAKKYVMNLVNDLLNNRVDISELVITKSLSRKIGPSEEGGGYKAKSAHVALAEKLAKRDPLNKPGIGDRIAYVILKGAKNTKLYERSEDPVYTMDKELPIDLDYYVENQLQGPIDRIFEVVFTNYISDDVFHGKATLNIVNNQQVSKQKGSLGSFVSTIYRCLSCNNPYKDSSRAAVCPDCKKKNIDKESELYVKMNWNRQSLQEEYKFLWTECQRCQGTHFDDIICSNNDCSIFYRRKKVIKDLEVCGENLLRFEL